MTEHRDHPPLDGPKLDGIRWIYSAGYYDGPLTGMVRLADGSEAWAHVVDECDCWDPITEERIGGGFYRRYQITRPTPEAYAVQQARHEDFRRHVGHHTDYDDHGKRQFGVGIHPAESHHLFYDKWLNRADDPKDGGDTLGWWET